MFIPPPTPFVDLERVVNKGQDKAKRGKCSWILLAMVEQLCEELMTCVTIILDPGSAPEKRKQCSEVRNFFVVKQ